MTLRTCLQSSQANCHFFFCMIPYEPSSTFFSTLVRSYDCKETLKYIDIDNKLLYCAVSNSEVEDVSLLRTLEYVAMTMTVEHAERGSLVISLTSPNGTSSTLSTTRKQDKSVPPPPVILPATPRGYQPHPMVTSQLPATPHGYRSLPP